MQDPMDMSKEETIEQACYEHEQAREQRAKVSIRTVTWCNTWNRARANDTDGMGTKTHLTAEIGASGKTLCGKTFPRDKGFPSTWGTCKKCLKKSGLVSTKDLASVPSVEDW